MSVLRAICRSGIRCAFTVQARFEVGFDDEMLDLLAQAGFSELAMDVEFLDDESFALYHKQSTHDRPADFVIENDLCGALIQAMYFVPGAPVCEENHGRLLRALRHQRGV